MTHPLTAYPRDRRTAAKIHMPGIRWALLIAAALVIAWVVHS